jgi:hypothetical protein
MVKTQRILNMVSGAERAIKLLVAVRSWHLPDFWPERLNRSNRPMFCRRRVPLFPMLIGRQFGGTSVN